MNYQLELFHSLLNSFLPNNSALLGMDGQTLALRGDCPAVFGTLPTATNTVCKYLKLKEGEIAILNDPYSGGTSLNDITLVMAVSEDILWARNTSLSQALHLKSNIEEEGLRIPPTPIFQKNQLNEVILGAIQAHPLCPAQLIPWLKEQVVYMQKAALRLHEAIEYSGLQVTPEMIQDYVSSCKDAAFNKINESASGETRVDLQLDSGEFLRVNMEIHDGKINLDFSGTSVGKTVFMTESVVYGACYHTISQFYGFTNLSNSGTFSTLQLVTPTSSWLNAKYPAPAHRGVTVGVEALRTALELALSQIHQKNVCSLRCGTPISIQLHGTEKIKTLQLGVGAGAAPNKSGHHAVSSIFSIEGWEKQIPVQFEKVCLKAPPSENFKRRGGLGLALAVRANQDLSLSWLGQKQKATPRLPKNFFRSEVSCLSVTDQGASQTLECQGEIVLKEGMVFLIETESGLSFEKQETE